jgi:tRNA (guanine37-N1)-methyltransferase
MFQINVVALLPELVRPVGEQGIAGRAVEQGLVNLDFTNPRDFAHDRHRTVDDRPYGGGPGMVLKYQPVRDAVRAARGTLPAGSREILLAPHGRVFDQAYAQELLTAPGVLLLAGRYEGVDERLAAEVSETLSLGDYVLSGGELAAAVVIDALVRLLPGALGHEASAVEDSFRDGLLDYPHYTRPETIDGLQVPAVLLGGNHEAIRRWRLQQALGRTWLRRPDLLKVRTLNDEEQTLLAEFQRICVTNGQEIT